MCSQVTDRAQARGAHWFGIRNAESYKAIGLSEAVAMSLWLEKNKYKFTSLALSVILTRKFFFPIFFIFFNSKTATLTSSVE